MEETRRHNRVAIVSFNDYTKSCSGFREDCENTDNIGKAEWAPIIDCREELNLAVTPPGKNELVCIFKAIFHIFQMQPVTTGELPCLTPEMIISFGGKTLKEESLIKPMERFSSGTNLERDLRYY